MQEAANPTLMGIDVIFVATLLAAVATLAVLTGVAGAADLADLADAVRPDIGHIPELLGLG